MNYLNWIAALSLGGALVLGTASAQEAAPPSGASKEGSKKISLVAVGDLPAITLTLTGDKGVVYDAAVASEQPPAQLFVKVKNDYKKFHLQLNCPVEAVEYPKGDVLNLYQSEADADTSDTNGRKDPYVSIPLPKEQRQLTVFLLRNPATKDWRQKPLAFPLNDDLNSFPRNATRVANLSSVPVRVMLGATIFDLMPHANRVVPYPTQAANGVLDYKIGVTIKGQNMMISNFSKSYYAGSRMNLVIYDTDGKQRKKPLESVILMGQPEEAPAQSGDAAPNGPTTR